MPVTKSVYDGKAHADARQFTLECGHKRLTYQVVSPNSKLYCPTCDSDQKVKL